MDEELVNEPEAKSGSKKLILIVVLALVLLSGGGVAAYLSGLLEADDVHEEPAKAEAPPPVHTVFYDLLIMLTNLASERGRLRFLKFTVNFKLTNPGDTPRLRQLKPRIIDLLQVYFRELRIDDLRESRGIPILRHELLVRINSAIHPAAISSDMLKEILIQ